MKILTIYPLPLSNYTFLYGRMIPLIRGMKDHEFDVITTHKNLSLSSANIRFFGPSEEKKGYRAIYYLLKNSIEMDSRERYDLIFTTRAIFASILPGKLLSILRRVPWVADCDDYEWYGPIHSKIGPPLIKASNALVVSSRELYKLTGGIYITNSTDPNEFDPEKYDGSIIAKKYKKKPKKVILWSGVINYKVNLGFLARLSKRVEECKDDICFVIMGGGERFESLRQMLPSNLKKTILTGWVNKPELFMWYAAASVGIFPFSDNKYDWCKSPIKLPEYMAMNLAIYTTPVGEPKYLVEELGCGEICYDENNMLEKICNRSPSELLSMGRKGREYIKKHPISEKSAELNKVFKEVGTRD